MATTEPAMPMNVSISTPRDSQPLRALPIVPTAPAVTAFAEVAPLALMSDSFELLRAWVAETPANRLRIELALLARSGSARPCCARPVARRPREPVLAGGRCCGPGIGPGTSVNRVQDGQLSLVDDP
jgi:hypothetical protein